MDEDNINEQYTEQMGIAFDDFLAAGNIEQCRKVIEQLQEDGFKDDANSLIDVLYGSALTQFIHPSSLLWL